MTDEIVIKLSPGKAQLLYDELVELPYRIATSFDSEPPTEREIPIDDVINQISEQMGWNDE